jgi:hypothetical protein
MYQLTVVNVLFYAISVEEDINNHGSGNKQMPLRMV